MFHRIVSTVIIKVIIYKVKLTNITVVFYDCKET